MVSHKAGANGIDEIDQLIIEKAAMQPKTSQQPRCKQRCIKLAAGYVPLAAFAKWMPTHPLGSLPGGIK